MTIEELVTIFEAMKPRRAITKTGINPDLCSMRVDVLTAIDDESGHVVEKVLKPINGGMIGAGYVRVSSDEQARSGWSLGDQVKMIAKYFFDLGQAFILYSDATISGFRPPDDADMIAETNRRYIRRYENNFRLILMGKHTGRTANELACLESYLQDWKKGLEEGGAEVIVSDAATEWTVGDDPAHVTSSTESDDEPEIVTKKRKHHSYRPALTLLMKRLGDFDKIVITDSSRWCRNYALMPQLVRRLRYERVQLVGLMENLDFISRENEDDDLELIDDFQLKVLSWTAQKQLNTMTVASLRGVSRRIAEKKPHGKPPGFLKWTGGKEGGKGSTGAEWKPGVRKAMERLIELVGTYKDDGSRLDYIDIGEIMQAEFPGVRLGHKYEWNRRNIVGMLKNRHLIGKHKHFGLEYELPGIRIMSDEDFERLQMQLQNVAEEAKGARGKRTVIDGEEVAYLATGLIRCVCGMGNLTNMHPGKITQGYSCQAFIAGKAPRGVRHTKLNGPDTDRFINNMFQTFNYSIAPYSAHDAARLYDLERAARATESALIAARKELTDAQTSMRAAFFADAQEEGYTEYDEQLEYVNMKLKNRTKAMRNAVQEAQENHSRVSRELNEMRSHNVAALVQDQIERWNTLSVKDRNAILLTVFERWEVRGTDPDCYIVAILKNGEELPPIKLRTTIRKAVKDGKEQYTRRFPRFMRWVHDSWTPELSRLLLEAYGGEWEIDEDTGEEYPVFSGGLVPWEDIEE